MLLRWFAFLALSSGLFCPVYAVGTLWWEQTTLVLTPKSTDQVATAVYKFRNIGKEPVVLSELRPDCSCVVTPLEKTRYEPGESGEMSARFAIGHQTGDHTVTIAVKGNAGEQAVSEVLILHVKIVDVVIFNPRFLYWKADEPLQPKTVEVALLPGESLTLRDVRVGNPAFQVKLITTGDPRHFTLLVTPPAQRTRSVCPITVITTSGDSTKTQEHTMVARLL